jgi:hypothetical protein
MAELTIGEFVVDGSRFVNFHSRDEMDRSEAK